MEKFYFTLESMLKIQRANNISERILVHRHKIP